MAGVLGNFCC